MTHGFVLPIAMVIAASILGAVYDHLNVQKQWKISEQGGRTRKKFGAQPILQRISIQYIPEQVSNIG